MTDVASELSWIIEDNDLVQELDRGWPGEGWREEGSDGLVATLDEHGDWSGWRDWAPDKKTEMLRELIGRRAGELLLGWIFANSDLTARLALAWNGDSWQDDGNDGLIAQLDADSDLSNWRTWDVNEQLSAVAVLLDRYVDSALMAGIDADTTLVARLDAVWEGTSWRTDPSGGLVATLDGNADRASWRAWALSDQLQVVSDLLTGWETPADEQSAEEPVAGAEDDLGQPRWNAGSNSWEVYNSDVKAWWLRDEPSGSWFDPTRGAWVPSLHWVVESQVTQLAEQYGKDEWSAKLVSALDDAWGADWQTRFEADGMRTQLDELLPFLREPPAEVIDADTLPETPADVAGEDTVAPSAETAKVLIEEVALPALRSAMAEVPGAESLSPDEIQQIITDVLTELSTESASA